MPNLNSNFVLRTLTFIDSLQPQLAQFMAKENMVYDPAEYDSALIVEIAPAMEIHTMVDLALKATKVRLGSLITEREFGIMEVHHADQGEVREAGHAILRAINVDENDRAKAVILTNKIIRSVEQDHAVLFTASTNGNMVLAGESIFLLETTPAAYVAIAGNEALKAANIKLVELKGDGVTGRLILSGTESEIDSAAEAALRVLEKLNAMQASKNGSQLG
jgi:ethanolamine utilization microcompartment shell protein EutS